MNLYRCGRKGTRPKLRLYSGNFLERLTKTRKAISQQSVRPKAKMVTWQMRVRNFTAWASLLDNATALNKICNQNLTFTKTVYVL